MSQVEALRRITEAAAAHAFATAQLANTRQRLDEALRLSGEVGTALRPFLLEREAPQRGLPPDPAPAWIAPEILRADDQEERFDAFVSAIDSDPAAEALVAEALAATAELVAVPPNDPETPDGSLDLDEPITLNQLAKLIGVTPPVVYDAEKLAAEIALAEGVETEAAE